MELVKEDDGSIERAIDHRFSTVEKPDASCVHKEESDTEIPAPSYESVIEGALPSCSLPKYNDIVITDAPPTYHSLFSDSLGNVMRTLTFEYQNDRNDEQDNGLHTNIFSFSREGFAMDLTIMFCLFVIVAFSLLLPITMMVIGILFINKCPIQQRIPIYLIVLGFFQMLECCGRIAYKFYYSNESRDSWRERYRRKDPLFYFLIVWFVIGSMWVYQTNPDDQSPAGNVSSNMMKISVLNGTSVNRTMFTTPKFTMLYCHKVVYGFAFWVITSYYGICALFCLAILSDLCLKTCCRCCYRDRRNVNIT